MMKSKDIIKKYVGYSFVIALTFLFCFLLVNSIIETDKAFEKCIEDARPTIECASIVS